jgi:hypothetical protein
MHIGDAQKIDKSGRTSQQATRNVLSCGSASQRPQGILLNLDSPANPTARLVGELKSCSSRVAKGNALAVSVQLRISYCRRKQLNITSAYLFVSACKDFRNGPTNETKAKIHR